jgi:hypothetical protein
MSDQEQARALDKFHDRFDHQKFPDWLRDEAKAKEKDYTYNLGNHTAEINKLGTLILSEPDMRMTLSAEEAYNLLTWLDNNHRDTLYKLTHRQQNQER